MNLHELNKLMNTKRIKKIVFLILFLALFIASIDVLSRNSAMLRYSGDEAHSIGITSQKFFTRVKDSRNLGGMRWALRLSYPVAMYYINKRMGGEHFTTGWSYPGHFYILKNFSDINIKSDPVLQDYVYFQRSVFIFIFISSLIFILYSLSKKYCLIAPAIYLFLLIGSNILRTELTYAYSDLFFISIFNFIYGIYIYGINRKNVLILIFLCCLISSTKLYGIIIAAPIIYELLLYLKNHTVDFRKGLYILIFSLLILNVYELSAPDDFLQYTLANIYHYNTGHMGAIPSGFHQIMMGINKLGISKYLLIPALIVDLISLLKYKKLNIINTLLVFNILTFLYLLSTLRIFMDRNWLILEVLISLYSAMVLGNFFSQQLPKIYNSYINSALIYLAISLAGIILYGHFTYDRIEALSNSFNSCKSIAKIGEYRSKIVISNSVPSIPDEYDFQKSAPIFQANVDHYDCILVSWDQNNKQYTHYFLPQTHNLLARDGDLFLFKKKLN